MIQSKYVQLKILKLQNRLAFKMISNLNLNYQNSQNYSYFY